MDGGITISTAQLVGSVVFLVTTIGSLLAFIRHQYETRINDLEVSFTARLNDRDRTIAELTARMNRFESREDERNRSSAEYTRTLETSVEVMRKQVEAMDALATRTRAPRRSSS